MCDSESWPASSQNAAVKPWSRSVIGSSANVSVRSEPTTRAAVLERALQRAEALVDLARLDRVVRGLHDQADPGDALLRAVVQRECQAAALALLDAQEAVGEAAALALAQLGLDAQRLGEREEAGVVRGAHGGGGEHAQLRALDGAEGVVGRAQHGERAGLERRDRAAG